jgi:energy-coupling factor transporter ATP-binding protein EcfA2
MELLSMKLESLAIRHFRAIESLDLRFVDDLGLIRDRIPIVGPNTSGKTTILDAIALCLMPVTEMFQFREGLRLTPASLVRRGAVRASVSCTVWFGNDEIEATREVMELAGNPYHRHVPEVNRVTVHWTFPDPQGRHRIGYYRCDPVDGWLLFRGRKILARNLHVPGLGSRYFRRVGGIVMFDQQRTGLAKHLSYNERNLLGHLLDPQIAEENAEEELQDMDGNGEGSRVGPYPGATTTDPRLILTSLAMRARVAQGPEATESEYFARLKELYERVCHPHVIGELYNTEHGLDLEFSSDRGSYYYDGLSSGQEMILLLLLQFATRRVHRSIVLIDELELHLHPLWQDRLFSALPSLGEDNQVLFTTHSTHLRDTIRDQFYHSTGELSNPTPTG